MTDAYVSEATKQLIGDKYLGGADPEHIAEVVGLTAPDVVEVLAELGIPLRVETSERERLDAEAAELYKSGLSIRAIVRQQGRSYGTVHRALEDRVRLRPRGAPSAYRTTNPPTNIGPRGPRDAP